MTEEITFVPAEDEPDDEAFVVSDGSLDTETYHGMEDDADGADEASR